MFLPTWTYGGADPGLRLFTLANPLLPGYERSPSVLEIGCVDTDWIERAWACDRGLAVQGVDWRRTSRQCVVQGDVLTWRPGFQVDVVISLSAIEHVGLGRYEHDPVDPYGDIKAIQRVREWLRPGGWCYFDVPYAPEGYWVKGTKCRVYDDVALRERFGPHEALGYTLPSVNGWIEKPTRNCDAPKPYYYVACLVRA